MLSMVVVMMMRSIGLDGKQVDNIDDLCAVADDYDGDDDGDDDGDGDAVCC